MTKNRQAEGSGFVISNLFFRSAKQLNVFFPCRRVEGELEVIWESTSNENRQLKALLHDSLKRSKCAAGDSSQGFQPNSAIGFSYCEVNSSCQQDEAAA